ncbi:MAG: arsenate reductase ArsC [Prolixibacteraceae bacterium]|jgi:arsenate reductase
MKILFLCTGGNSCRSLMAEAFLQEMDPKLEVFSAGLRPDDQADRLAIEVMNEIGIDISTKQPKGFQEYASKSFDFLITLCDGTKDKITTVDIQAKHKIHLGFEDPKKANYPKDQLVDHYREIRDEIKNELDYFYSRILMHELLTKQNQG